MVRALICRCISYGDRRSASDPRSTLLRHHDPDIPSGDGFSGLRIVTAFSSPSATSRVPATLAMMTVLQVYGLLIHRAPAGSLPRDSAAWYGQLWGVRHLWHSCCSSLRYRLCLAGHPWPADLHHRPATRAGRACRSQIPCGHNLCYVCHRFLRCRRPFLVGFVGTVDNWVGRGYELDSIVACVIAVVALSGAGDPRRCGNGSTRSNVLVNIAFILGLPVRHSSSSRAIIVIAAVIVARGR